MRSTLTGVDEFVKRLNDLQKSAQSIDGEVPLCEILTDDFVRENTTLKTFDELMESANIHCDKDFDEASSDALDDAIQNVSSYKTFQEFVNDAASEYVMKKLDF